MTRQEFTATLHPLILIAIGSVATSTILITGVIRIFELNDAWMHYSLAISMTAVMAPATAFPLILLTQRLRRMKQELEILVRTDILTEMPNRRAFFEYAGQAFEQSGGGAIALMMIDIDHFKAVNDRHGHDAGDATLHAVAETIHHAVELASVPGAKIAARIGGEEFAVMVSGVDRLAARSIAESLCAAVRHSPCFYGDVVIASTISIGIAMRGGGETVDEVLRVADNAVYEAKRLGRDRWCEAPSALGGGLIAESAKRPSAVRLQPRVA